ncbi:epidermal growth factor receptor kinase substrate 8-like protein 3 [Chanos chanos]|uniref:Epidermal growth factor receptor kinase substrate 8-like protein 3 n=1 Tax=Chanos chanos TaxID=29144 RepID=A0A6J2VR32_CHACN|nr:epidermal growth factor receptor kinase substrate 8-like protein 3 [Chanos chanos]
MYRDPTYDSLDSNSYAGSVWSNGYTNEETASQLSGLSRPSAKSIYMQRKEYAESIKKQLGKFQYRVEHLLTCDLDGKEMYGVDDCIERLVLLDNTDRVWGQDMILEVQDGNLLLSDIETKEELECLPLSSVSGIKAVPDCSRYKSLLTVTARMHNKRSPSVFMFQCEALKADVVEKDLKRALRNRKENDNRNYLSMVISDPVMGQNLRRDSRNSRAHEPTDWPRAESSPFEWSAPDYDETLKEDSPVPTSPTFRRSEPMSPPLEEEPNQSPPPCSPPPPELLRDADRLNQLINDIEEFTNEIAAVAPEKKKKKSKKKKEKDVEVMPPLEEFETCLKKFKMAFNLLGQLNGKISDPSAPELVHCLFSTLEFVVSRCPEGLPPTIVSPRLTMPCFRFLGDEVTPEEDRLWQSLGDAWNVPGGVFKRSDSLATNFMRALYDFTARNYRELTVSKGEVVELLDTSKQWWKVRNVQGEEGYVPNNVLKSSERDNKQDPRAVPHLTKRSKPDEVKAWLEYKGFSKVTVKCLGVVSGSMLLGMTREELKTLCPEEGGRVFYQLQNVKSALAVRVT